MKIRFTYKSGSRQGEVINFANQSTIKLGRDLTNDVVFDSSEDSSVSGFHAEVRIINNEPELFDLESTNGIFVNGKRTRSSLLKSEDVIQLGPSGSAFSIAIATEETAKEPLAKTDVVQATDVADTVDMDPPGTVQPSAEKLGKRTMGMMIEAAINRALGKTNQNAKNTDYFEKLVDKNVKKSASRYRKVLIIGISAMVLVGLGTGSWFWKNRSVSVVQQYNYGDATGSSVARQNRYAVFLLAGYPVDQKTSTKSLEGFCTAFAISANILATNAHCIEKGKTNFGVVYAIMNGAPSNRYAIDLWATHPNYEKDAITPDVGLLRIQGQLTHIVSMASSTDLAKVETGVPVYVYGFPGLLNVADAPEATFVRGEIGRVTNFKTKVASFGDNTLLQHSAFAAKGTSGSPIFNTFGLVIGINSGGYMENGEVLYGYNLGMRIDLIKKIYPLMGLVSN